MSQPPPTPNSDESAKDPSKIEPRASRKAWTFSELRVLAAWGAITLISTLTPLAMRYFGAPWIETIFLLPAAWCVMYVVAHFGLHFFGIARRGQSNGGEAYGEMAMVAIFLGSILAYLIAKLIQFLFF